jgi:signal transduction histidine kinase
MEEQRRDSAPSGCGCLFWPFNLIPWLFGIPIIRWWRRNTRRSLGWRLAGSHFAVVVYSIIAICACGFAFIVGVAYFTVPAENDAAGEAKSLVNTIEKLQRDNGFSNDQLSSLLVAFTTGDVAPNTTENNIRLFTEMGRVLDNVNSVSIVDRRGIITVSSNPAYVGARAAETIYLSGPVTTLALDGSTDLAANSIIAEGGMTVGAYPFFDDEGQVTSALVLEKFRSDFGNGRPLWVQVSQVVAGIGILFMILVGVPGLPIGVITGIRRARAISKPITALAVTANRLAQGDFTARVKVKGQDELASLQTSFNEMADGLQNALANEANQRARAEQALEANRQLVANVSHELRTPVAVVRAHLEAMSTDTQTNEEYLRIAIRETDRLEHLVEDLFSLTRLEIQGLELVIAPFDAGSAVREAVESLAEPARRESGLTLTSEISADDLTCLADRGRLVQVLQNLMRNSIRYTPEGGIVLATAAAEGHKIVISVRDTGIGISPEDLPYVFDRFYRADQSRNRGSGGAGLGLAIAQQLVQAMHGTIEVESMIDEGTIFTIRLPRVRQSA